MSRPPLTPEAIAVLRAPNAAVIATVDDAGRPHTAATWFLWHDPHVLVNMDAARVRVRYLRRDPHVSLTVVDGETWYHQVTVRGRVIDLYEDRGLRDIDLLSRHYDGVAYPTRTRDRISAVIEIAHWYGWGSADV